jgi:hypothetical protein
MTPAEASAAFGRDLIADGSENPAACETYNLGPGVEPEGMRFLARDGRLARIDDHGSEGVATPEGIGVGATLEAVRAAYPGAAEAATEEGATMVTVWTVRSQRGYRFVLYDGRVTNIAAGDDAILLTEGCS